MTLSLISIGPRAKREADFQPGPPLVLQRPLMMASSAASTHSVSA
jgi:hypothetical protein